MILNFSDQFRIAIQQTSPFYVIEATCIAIFTLELLVRIITAPPHLISFSPLRMDFFRDVMNIVDILAILPFYIEMVRTLPACFSLRPRPCSQILSSAVEQLSTAHSKHLHQLSIALTRSAILCRGLKAQQSRVWRSCAWCDLCVSSDLVRSPRARW